MKKLSIAILLLTCASPSARSAEIDFQKDVAPILREYLSLIHI